MKNGFLSASVRLWPLTAGVLCIIATAVMAQPVTPTVAGCDPVVMDAMNAKAQAQVAYDVAVIRELVDAPESVLDLTCFTSAAGVSAVKGGAVFSGDFTTPLKTLMGVTGNGTYNCNAMADMWKSVSEEGINKQAPYASFTDLMSGTMPSPATAGADFKAGWKAATDADVFTNLQTTVSALPRPQPMDFTAAKSSCDVLVAAGIIPGPCPGDPTGSADPTTK